MLKFVSQLSIVLASLAAVPAASMADTLPASQEVAMHHLIPTTHDDIHTGAVSNDDANALHKKAGNGRILPAGHSANGTGND
ncbi:hypothetical protein [Rhizobium halophytocola]|uniref:DUF680 domain-containing protein n=1 Tax=Rhizobium halophytocola TaxID=735519 RepID=A0ABS4DZ88_9HYPH|nr:hypothetical protein [Rhizobium halophytocola]MBP1851008.1 hypothetical protein [Rhizobium halophytocola]